MPAEWLGSLRAAVSGVVLSDASALASAGRDASFVVGRPDAVVRPADPDDVVALVRWARTHRVALTARGGGTSLDGECVPVRGGVVVDFAGWNSIGEVDPVTRTVRVGPGVINHDLAEALRPSGWFFPPNPGSWRSSTIGGNLATNASGPRSFRYGPTRRWVHAAEVVLGTGERVVLGPSTAKRAVGPELLDLVVGSEGTLALATSVVLRLAPSPARRCAVVATVPVGAPLGPVAVALTSRPTLRLAAIEYVDERVGGLLRARPGAKLPGEGPLILLEVESDGSESEEAALTELETVLTQS
ncbi:MAG TPA: FAD-binding oxidoreductase, partial [Thermoplasmata archaeon]|nr:FAD-binding oxidoreductase [Thermoplasmata archaeon]